MTEKQIKLLRKVVKYSERYEISVQFWPEQNAIFIAKDDVDLNSFGSSDLTETLQMGVDYLDRINKKP
jgi:hypothetical protein